MSTAPFSCICSGVGARLALLNLVWISTLAYPLSAQDCTGIVKSYRKAVVYVHVERTYKNTGKIEESAGTGFILSSEGYVLTAKHLVTQAADVDRLVITGAIASAFAKQIPMEMIDEAQPPQDLALLKLQDTSQSYHAVSIGNPSRTPEGAPVCTMGFPLGVEFEQKGGHVGGKGGPKGWWYTDIPSTCGESGAPVFSLRGKRGKVVAVQIGGLDFSASPCAPAPVNLLVPVNLVSAWLLIAGNGRERRLLSMPLPLQD